MSGQKPRRAMDDRGPLALSVAEAGLMLSHLTNAVTVIQEMYPGAYFEAYSGGGSPETKVQMAGSDPTGELATDDGSEALRAQLRYAGRDLTEMVTRADRVVWAMRQIVAPSTSRLPHTQGVYRWTEEDARAVEARRRSARNGR